MIIDGFTVCVGKEYSQYLSESIGRWLGTLDSVTIITKPGDIIVENLKHFSRQLRIIETDIFTRYGAHFNKGAALELALEVVHPIDWVLQFDSDIQPPINWRERWEDKLERGSLYGSSRFDVNGNRVGQILFPSGYFQLWYYPDSLTSHNPYTFNPFYTHAGSYDAEFADQWGKHRIRDLRLRLLHKGERRQNWFGPDDNGTKMKQMTEQGFREARSDESWMIPIEYRHTIMEDIKCLRLVIPQIEQSVEV